MIIRAGTTILAGDPADCVNGHKGLRVGSRAAVQEDALIGGAAPARFARGNRVWTVSFSAVKRFGTEGDAEAWALDVAALDSAGLMTCTLSSAADSLLLTLTDCSVEGDASVEGVVTSYAVTIRGIG